MIEEGKISRVLYDCAKAEGGGQGVEEVRIGLGYVGVVLDSGRVGLAAVLRDELTAGCSVFNGAGSLAGSKASHLLNFLVHGGNPLHKALGLAAANAILCPEPPRNDEIEAIDAMKLTPEDRVAMVGFFGPLVKRIKATGATLAIIEKDPRRPGIKDGDDQKNVLSECTVAIITATSIINGTIEAVLNSLGDARHGTVLGPSTPLSFEPFRGTGVNHLGGAACIDNKKIMQIISEGGGTPAMRPYLHFINLFL